MAADGSSPAKKKGITRWTEDQLDQLENVAGWEGANLARAYALFPGRTPASIRRALRYYGIREPVPIDESAARPWTRDEEQILIKDYARMGPRGLAQSGELDRTHLAIQKRAAVLGIQELRPRAEPMGAPWSPAEYAIAASAVATRRKTGEINWPRLLASLPGRSRKSVEGKLYVLSTEGAPKRVAHRLWTPEQDAIVVARYAELGASAIGEMLGRSQQSVINRAYDLKVTRTRKMPTGA